LGWNKILTGGGGDGGGEKFIKETFTVTYDCVRQGRRKDTTVSANNIYMAISFIRWKIIR
jgi:hypothetical protein